MSYNNFVVIFVLKKKKKKNFVVILSSLTGLTFFYKGFFFLSTLDIISCNYLGILIAYFFLSNFKMPTFATQWPILPTRSISDASMLFPFESLLELCFSPVKFKVFGAIYWS